MKETLYIFQNGELKRKDNSLYFETDEKRRYIPVENTNDIYIFGEVDVSKKFLEFVSQKGICLHFFNHYAYYIGIFYPREHLNASYIILKQAEYYSDANKRFHLLKSFVEYLLTGILFKSLPRCLLILLFCIITETCGQLTWIL